MALVLMLALFVTGCGKDFDASGYTQALLDLTFQGDTSRARTYMEDATENSLMRQYQQSIDNFVAANITSEIEMNETKTAQFADLVSKIFATMRYDVGKADVYKRQVLYRTLSVRSAKHRRGYGRDGRVFPLQHRDVVGGRLRL